MVVGEAEFIGGASVFKEDVLFDGGRSAFGRGLEGLGGVFDEVVGGIWFIGFSVDFAIYFILLYLEGFTLGTWLGLGMDLRLLSRGKPLR